MNPDENNESQRPATPSGKKVIQPLDAEAVKSYLAENAASTPPVVAAQPESKPETTPADHAPNITQEKWKPNTPLSSRVPKLKTWGMVYVGAGLFNAIANRNLLTLRHSYKLQPLVLIIFVLMFLMIICGLIFIFSKNKLLVQTCLNGLVLLGVLMALLSLLTINIVGIIVSVILIGSVSTIKKEVKAAA